MPIIPLLQGRAYGPEDIKVMPTAFDGALNALGLMDRADPLNELVAKKIIEIAKTGERNPSRLRRLRLLPAAPRHLHGSPLPWGGQRPPVFHRVRSSCYRAADRKPRGRDVRYPVHLYHNTIQRANAARARYRFVSREGGTT